MAKKILNISDVFIFLLWAITVFLLWGITVFFFPAIDIDGRQYSKKTILQLKARHKKYLDINLASLAQKVNGNIETRFSAYMEGINKMSFADYTDDSLSEIIKEAFAEIDTAENNFIAEFENMLQHKAKLFTLPLQTRDKSGKDAIIKDVFPNMKNYSINNRIYYGFALDAVMEKLRIFKNRFPQSARNVIENNVNGKHEQYLINLASQIEISANVEDSLRQTVLELRKHGETLLFFEHLIQECDITGIFENINCTIQPLDISEDFTPVLLPVCIVDETVYDAFSLNSVSNKLKLLRTGWKQIREDNIGKILDRQMEIVIRNLSSYNDIDDGIDIDELPALIAYYGKQIPVSAGLFSTELKQCIYAAEEPDKYPIESFSGVIDISPLSIDIVNIGNKSYDAAAVSRLSAVITAIRMKWNSFLFQEDEKIKNNIQYNFRNYYESNYGYYLMDTGMKEMTSVIDYITEASGISEDLFSYFYDNCSVASGAFAGTVIESDVTKIDIEPFVLHVTDIDGGKYYTSGVNALRQSMQNLTGTIDVDIRKNLSSIINIKTDECIANIEPYLAWYFDDGLSNDWLTSLWQAFKTKAFGYDEAAELNKKYRQHFYPFLEMGNDIQDCLLLFSEKIEDLAFYYVLWLDIFHVSPYLLVQTEQTIEGNDFMAPCQKTPDYIRLFAENTGERFKLSFINVDNIDIVSNINIVINIVINAGSDIAMDAAVGAIGGAIAGPPGVAIGTGAAVVAGIATNANTFKTIKEKKFDEYKRLLRDSFEKNRRYLIAIL